MISIDNIYNKFTHDMPVNKEEQIYVVQQFVSSTKITTSEKYKVLHNGFDTDDIFSMVNRIIVVRR